MSWIIERVKHLVEFLENLNLGKNEYFNINFWYDQKPCGTFGCALGWYSVLNTDMSAGFSADRDNFLSDATKEELELYWAIFGITNVEDELVTIKLYNKQVHEITAKDVAQKLRELILEKKDENNQTPKV